MRITRTLSSNLPLKIGLPDDRSCSLEHHKMGTRGFETAVTKATTALSRNQPQVRPYVYIHYTAYENNHPVGHAFVLVKRDNTLLLFDNNDDKLYKPQSQKNEYRNFVNKVCYSLNCTLTIPIISGKISLALGTALTPKTGWCETCAQHIMYLCDRNEHIYGH